jgi:hypothetical protein
LPENFIKDLEEKPGKTPKRKDFYNFTGGGQAKQVDYRPDVYYKKSWASLP